MYVLKCMRELEFGGSEGVQGCCVLVSGEACSLKGTGLGVGVGCKPTNAHHADSVL